MTLPALLVRLVQGDPRKKTRLHDFRGNLVPLAGLAYLPHCLASTARVKLLGSLPPLPWLGYRAIHRLERLLQPSWRVLEMGSGQSSTWLARRCGELWTVENEPAWYDVVARSLAGVGHAHLILQPPPYDGLAERIPHGVDFALVDGVARDEAMGFALRQVRPGGYVYLDNADVADAQHERARDLLLAAAAPGTVERFVDLAPGKVTASQGLLARLR